MRIARVVSDADGGGYYNCQSLLLDADDWETNNQITYNSEDEAIIVLNLAEQGTENHALGSGDLITYWLMSDDEGNARYIGLGYTKIDIQTDYQFDDPNFQVKKRENVMVLGSDNESDWVTQHSGTECD